jgi:cell division protease FtsH
MAKPPFKHIITQFGLAVYDACKSNKTKTAVIVGVILGSYFLISNAPRIAEGYRVVQAREKSYTEFMDLVAQDQIGQLKLSDQGKVEGKLRDGKEFTTVFPERNQEILDRLIEKKVSVKIDRTPPAGYLDSLFNVIIAVAVTIGLLSPFKFGYDIIKAARNNYRKRMNPDAEDTEDKRKKITFNDVAGIDEAVGELKEIVEFLRDPARFKKMGARIPKGALLVGPPGTGKTRLARAVAGEANVPFFVYSGSDFFRKWAGHGADFVRDVFNNARKHSPCIIFIDEIDAIGKTRSSAADSGSAADDRAATLNQLLTGIDGFEGSDGIVILAATNRPDVLDPAITRPGRIDRRIEVPNPDVNGREAILRVHTRGVLLEDDVDLNLIARSTSGFSGADLENLVNEAALLALRVGKEKVGMQDFDRARDRIIMGAERKLVMTDDEKKLTAYHEAGHALISILVPGLNPLHKVSIVPRGRALGVTMNLPERDRYSMSKPELEAHLQMVFGGRAAEAVILGENNITSGAEGDIQQATRIARSMVTKYGFSELGPIDFLGRNPDGTLILSEATQEKIDNVVRDIVLSAEKKAIATLKENKETLDLVADALLKSETETLTADQVKALVPPGLIARRATSWLAPAAE